MAYFKLQKMRKNINILFLSVICISTVAACAPVKENVATEENVTLQSQMLANKIKYVGDNSGVDKLLGQLPQFDPKYVQNMFALQTSQEPYGLTIYYEAIADKEEEDMIASEEMKTDVGFLFDCIDNLGYLEIAYRRSPSHQKLEESAYLPLLRMDRPAAK